MSWRARMLAASSEFHADSANCVDRSGVGAIGAIGTNGTDRGEAPPSAYAGLLAQMAPLAHSLDAPPPCPAELGERAAILIEAADMAPDEADAAALGEAGLATTDALANVLKSHVLAELARVEPAAAKDAHRLMTVTRAFVASPQFRDAVSHGWTIDELFAVHAETPTRRLDGMGLVVTVALSRLGSRLEEIEADRAVLRAKSGGTLTYRRFVASLENSRPWWECPTLCRPALDKREDAA